MDPTLQKEMAQQTGHVPLHTVVHFEWNNIVQLPLKNKSAGLSSVYRTVYQNTVISGL